MAPSQLGLLWERYRSLVWVVVLAVLGALAVPVVLQKYEQGKADANWSSFAATLGLRDAYSDEGKLGEAPAESLAAVSLEQLKAGLATALDSQKPFVLLAIARRAMLDQKWDDAEASLAELEAKYPDHSLVRATPHPVQSQDPVKPDGGVVKPQTPKPKKPEVEPAVAGSAVALVRAQIAAAKIYVVPHQFAKIEVPADAAKIKFELSGDFGSFVIALMPQSPLHRDAFLKLAKEGEGFWKSIAVDEIRRPAKFNKQPRELHLGFETTKLDDRGQWNTTEPSKNLVEFERTGLSHFTGAVSARSEADGKSCADRFWIAVDDAPRYDGERVIFGFVVEGLDNLKRVCEATMSAQEEERGQGRPSENIRVVAVTVLQ